MSKGEETWQADARVSFSLRRFLGSKNGRVETLSPGDSVAKRRAPTVAGLFDNKTLFSQILAYVFRIHPQAVYLSFKNT